MFTPVETGVGAVLLHLATTRLFFDNGAILGASSLIRSALSKPATAATKNAYFFVAGVASAALLTRFLLPGFVPRYPTFGFNWHDVLRTGISSILVGWGARTSGGCTSGHMLCGIGHLRPRSILATAIFFPTAMTTFHLANTSLETAVCEVERTCYSIMLPNKATTLLLAGLLFAAITRAKIPTGLLSHVNAESATYLTSGLLFGLGLLISGMADPAKVQAFFALRLRPFNASKCDPSLVMVILLGVVPNIIRYQRHSVDKPPRFAEKWSLPRATLKDIDVRFVLGAVAFGVGWGLTGVCPGPALLRTIAQPSWGVLWMAGFWAGSLNVL